MPTLAAIAELDALVDAWLAAQNDRAFDAYAALYAEPFTGIKRVGGRASAYDRVGWLADRRKMFRAPMRVTLGERVHDVGVDRAVVTFTQTFSQGTFSDRGEKELVIVRVGDALRIAREELLASKVDRAVGGLSFVVAGHAVLGAGQPSLGAGAPRLVVLADGWVAVLRDVATPPASHAGLIGHRVTALGGDAACRATLGALALMWLVRPHGATVARWDNLDGSGRAWTQAERAREAMSLAGAPLLVAALDGCAGRAWVDLDGRSPALTRLDAAPRTVGNWTAAIMSSHMGPVFQHDPQRPWAQEFAPSVYVDAAGAPRWLLGTLAAGEPCQDRVEVTVVWRQQDSHRAVQAAPDAGSLTDIDGDDVPELLTEAAIYRWSKDGAWTSIVTLPRRDLDAPC